MDTVVVQVFHAFRAQERHQLSISVGEKLTVVEKDPSGWWIGRNAGGQVGIFPSTYTRVVANAPPPIEVTREVMAAKLVQELGLGAVGVGGGGGGGGGGSSGSAGGSGGAFYEADDDVEDIDDLFALTDSELETAIAEASKERNVLKERAADALRELVDVMIEEKQGNELSERLMRERQHLTISRRTLTELSTTEVQLQEDVEDMREVLRARGIEIPRCIAEAEHRLAQQRQRLCASASPARATSPRRDDGQQRGPPASPSSSSAAAGAPVQMEAGLMSPTLADGEDWLAGVQDRRLLPYCRLLEQALRRRNEELDSLEVTLEGLAKSAKLLEAQVGEKSASIAAEAGSAAQQRDAAAAAIVQRSKGELREASETYAKLKEEAAAVRATGDALERKIAAATAEVEKGKAKFLQLTAAVEAGREQLQCRVAAERDLARADANIAEAKRLEGQAAAALSGAKEKLLELQGEMKQLLAQHRVAERRRRETYNQIQELKGNLRVYCRIKPRAADETAECIDVVDDMTLRVSDPETFRTGTYEFDLVLQQSASQEEIFEEVRPLATSVLDGYNICIFAYGQTGSGKTYTMEGPPANRGVNYRAVRELFNNAAARHEEYDTQLSVSVLEIYNDKYFDLLGGRAQTRVRWGGSGVGVVVDPLVTKVVLGVDDVQAALEAAYSNRSVAGTDCNTHSSRSHCILTVYVSAVNRHNRSKLTGKLHLIDLAGSERVKKSGVEGDRLREAVAINTSLTHLKTVIQALANKSDHVAYRNSALTALLQDSLGGNCKCLMFANISPHTPNIPETICTLKYAAEARKVEVGRVTANVTNGNSSKKKSPAAATPTSASTTPVSTPLEA